MCLVMFMVGNVSMAIGSADGSPFGHDDSAPGAPNSGDGDPDGSGFDHDTDSVGDGDGPAPNSGDGISDGSGW